jgi:hypothetical protein
MNKLLTMVALAGLLVNGSALADNIPDMGKDMAKGQMEGPDHKSEMMKQKRHYKTMQMKQHEMAAKMAASSAPMAAMARSGTP